MSTDNLVQKLAKRMCRHAGYDPDMLVCMAPPEYIFTPHGKVFKVEPSKLAPLSTFWELAAHNAIQFLREKDQ